MLILLFFTQKIVRVRVHSKRKQTDIHFTGFSTLQNERALSLFGTLALVLFRSFSAKQHVQRDSYKRQQQQLCGGQNVVHALSLSLSSLLLRKTAAPARNELLSCFALQHELVRLLATTTSIFRVVSCSMATHAHTTSARQASNWKKRSSHLPFSSIWTHEARATHGAEWKIFNCLFDVFIIEFNLFASFAIKLKMCLSCACMCVWISNCNSWAVRGRGRCTWKTHKIQFLLK